MDNFDNFVECIQAFQRAKIPHSMNWGSAELRSEKHQQMLIDAGTNLTVHTLIAIVLPGLWIVFSTIDGAFLFTKSGETYQRREQKITLDKEGFHFEITD